MIQMQIVSANHTPDETTSITSPKPTVDTRAMGIMHRARDVDRHPQAQLNGNRGREAENAGQDKSGQRRKMSKADRLSKRYFRIHSWNCASANGRGAVQEQMVYDFDVICLRETRTCLNRPLVLQGFTVIQRHQGNTSLERSQQDISLTQLE